MKIKLFLIGASVLILLSALLFFGPLQFDKEHQVTIGIAIDEVSPQITQISNWAHWFGGVKKMDSSGFYFKEKKYTLIQAGPTNVLVKEEGTGNTAYHYFTAFSDSSGHATHVTWVRGERPFYWIKNKLDPSREMDSVLQNLKTYLEDPLKYYGFRLFFSPVIDTLVITQRAITSKINKLRTLAGLYANLRNYANSHDIPQSVNEPRMAYFYPVGKDSLQIWAGMAVNSRKSPSGGIEYLVMPKTGKTLIGLYEGPYSGLGKLYDAMDRFAKSRNLNRVPSQYEKYLTDPSSPGDSLHMKIEIHYAIL